MAELINLALGHGNLDYWIGLNDLAAEGNFTWIHHGDVLDTFSAWSMNEPDGGSDQNCVAMNAQNTFFWSDEDCR